MKTVSKEEYQRRVELASPPSPVGKDCLLAFLFGGAICTLGQALCNLYQSLGLELPQARTGVSISLIFLSALLTALGLYDKIAQHAGAGTQHPLYPARRGADHLYERLSALHETMRSLTYALLHQRSADHIGQPGCTGRRRLCRCQCLAHRCNAACITAAHTAEGRGECLSEGERR